MPGRWAASKGLTHNEAQGPELKLAAIPEHFRPSALVPRTYLASQQTNVLLLLSQPGFKASQEDL